MLNEWKEMLQLVDAYIYSKPDKPSTLYEPVPDERYPFTGESCFVPHDAAFIPGYFGLGYS